MDCCDGSRCGKKVQAHAMISIMPQESNDGDPRHFLDTMEPHLGNGGCIKSVDEVAAIVQ